MTARVASALLAAAFAAAPLSAADPPAVHGSSDAYAGQGIALAWAVLRGADDARTQVVLRIERAEAAPTVVTVVGIDPFSQARQVLLPPAPIAGGLAFRSPRARFADYPRTELRFYTDAAAATADTPALVVYYLGVPDTTPEFGDPAKLDAYLAERLAKARREEGKP